MLTSLPENSLFLELPHSALCYGIMLPLQHPAFYIPYLATVTAARGLMDLLFIQKLRKQRCNIKNNGGNYKSDPVRSYEIY